MALLTSHLLSTFTGLGLDRLFAGNFCLRLTTGNFWWNAEVLSWYLFPYSRDNLWLILYMSWMKGLFSSVVPAHFDTICWLLSVSSRTLLILCQGLLLFFWPLLTRSILFSTNFILFSCCQIKFLALRLTCGFMYFFKLLGQVYFILIFSAFIRTIYEY